MQATVDELLDLQTGVVARHQLLERGWADHDIARMVRRRLWTPIHAGVYVDHTGEPTWLQQAWAAVLFSWPSALSHWSSLRAVDGPGRRDTPESPIHVVVAGTRHLTPPAGVRIHRLRGFEDHVQWNLSPPRVRVEDAIVDIAAAAESELAAVAVLAQGVQSRRTTAERLLACLEKRTRLRRRAWLGSVLEDITSGTCSALEHGYLHRVERPHRLPDGERQAAGQSRAGRIYRDVSYAHALELELDGRLFHDTAGARDRDFDRDLTTLVGGRVTARLSWGQVFDRPCWTAGQVGVLLKQRGWPGSPTPCGATCELGG